MTLGEAPGQRGSRRTRKRGHGRSPAAIHPSRRLPTVIGVDPATLEGDRTLGPLLDDDRPVHEGVKLADVGVGPRSRKVTVALAPGLIVPLSKPLAPDPVAVAVWAVWSWLANVTFVPGATPSLAG
jgi:hypothetical protein